MTRSFCVLLALLTLLALSGFGQQKLSVSATLTPFYVNTAYTRYYQYPDSDGQIVEPIYLDGHVGANGYSAGLTVYYTYAPGWSVATGIWYHQVSTRLKRPAGDGTTTIRNRAMRFPILLNYRASDKKLSPYFSLGLLVDIPFSSRVLVDQTGQSTQNLRLESEGGPVFSTMAGAGAVYQLNAHMALTLQPTITYRLGRFGGALTNHSTYELGAVTQLIYTF